MKLSLVHPYLSIKVLPDQHLPSFTIITGVNGAGKSHLLKAIQSGAVSVDVVLDRNNDTRLFDWTNMTPRDEGDFSSETIRQEQLGLYNLISQQHSQAQWSQALYTQAKSAGVRGEILTDLPRLATATEEELRLFVEAPEQASNAKRVLEQTVQGITNQIMSNLQPSQQFQLRDASNKSGRPIPFLQQKDFSGPSKPNWGQSELFQQSFSRLFVAYRDLHLSNRAARLAITEGENDVTCLTEKEFVATYEPPPWEFVNASLRAAALDFTINSPERFSFNPYKARLQKSKSNAEILFNDLSSGERVLMSFAFALYYANDSRQIVSRPKLLLLDEIDAPLHPSMCRHLLATIQQVLVEQCQINVVMTTHSPSTVALSPEEAIYVMRPGVAGLVKTTKDAAISALTYGVPTLSISYEGRRQVFVESPNDAEIYQSSYDAIRHHLASELTINFIATGAQSPSGQHFNTGCSVVRKIVADLRAGYAKNISGLVDWDGENSSGDGIIVLAEGERDGLESVLFDPLLILNAFVRNRGPNATEIGLPIGTTYTSLLTLPAAVLQIALDEVQRRVLGRSRIESFAVKYIGGLELLVDREYVCMDDHELEKKVFVAFPSLHAIARNRVGELAKWISQVLMPDRPQHVPVCLLMTFNRILSQ